MNVTNADIASVKNYQAALEELVRKHHLAANDLTENQLAEAIRQAIACGDFQRLVVATGGGAQQIIYIPFSEQARLQARIQELEAGLKRCGECGRYSITDDVGVCICNPKEFWLDTPAAQEPKSPA